MKSITRGDCASRGMEEDSNLVEDLNAANLRSTDKHRGKIWCLAASVEIPPTLKTAEIVSRLSTSPLFLPPLSILDIRQTLKIGFLTLEALYNFLNGL
jgi:hypothetical protein